MRDVAELRDEVVDVLQERVGSVVVQEVHVDAVLTNQRERLLEVNPETKKTSH